MWIPQLRSPNHSTLYKHMNKALRPPIIQRHILRQTPQHRARSLMSKIRLNPAPRALQSDCRRPITENFWVHKICLVWSEATYSSKVLDGAHIDRGCVYGGNTAGVEVRESEGYGRLDVRDQVIAVDGLADGYSGSLGW